MPLLMGCQSLIKERGQQHNALESHPEFMTLFWSLLVIFAPEQPEIPAMAAPCCDLQQVLSSGSWLTHCLHAKAQSRMQGAGCRMQGTGCRMQCNTLSRSLCCPGNTEHVAGSHSKLGKNKVKSGVGQLDCARNTGINGTVPWNQLCVSLPEAMKRQGGLIIV